MKTPLTTKGIVAVAMLLVAAAVQAQPASAPATRPRITRDATPVNPGILSFTVESDYQKGPNALEVLLPDKVVEGRRLPVVYILPVNTGTRGPWGSGIVEVQKADLHNRYQVICVAPAFDTEPWYGDNPANPRVRQQAYLLDVVVPFVDSEFPTIADASGRHVVGFSKSGMGALSLFLRNLDTFGRVAAFDPALGPPSQEAFRTWQFAASYGTRENFDLFDPILLLEKKQKQLQSPQRRIALLAGGPGSRTGVDVIQARLKDLKVPYIYTLGSDMGHTWNSGWLPLAFASILPPAATTLPTRP